jgi:uncharacterized protein DUF6893
VRSLGIAASVVIALLVLASIVVFLMSLPDLARYRRLRRM